jgi:DNA-binding transcriptional ArsR family regulator
MGVTKTTYYNNAQNEMALIAKALGHPARIAILEYMLKVNTCICTDIVKEIPLAQPTISQHLKELKNAQIIKGNIEGNSICYCIQPDSLQKLYLFLGNVLQQISKQENNCC